MEIQGKKRGAVLMQENFQVTKEVLYQKKIVFHFKRLVDILAGAIGLIVVSPIILFVAIVMKKQEPRGPIIFIQTRVGRNGKEFQMYKIRSMVVNAEEKLSELLSENEVEGAMFKMKKDPRVTKIGQFIRKTSIDELPQLWNILKGDMSLVGPRPPLPREVLEYDNYDLQRLIIKPGCTGLWQVCGRNSLGFKEMVALDIAYINNISIINDIHIILKTIWVVFNPKGAY